jgi:hypothetical protein
LSANVGWSARTPRCAASSTRRDLDVRILDANQRRQDVVKRIDELITQIDHLGAQLDAQSESLNE